MDQQLIAQKLESLRRCIQRVESKMPEDIKSLMNDLDSQDIISLNLTRAVQMCVDIAAHWLAENSETLSPKTMGQTFEALAKAEVIDLSLSDRLRKSVGFRNVMVHSYDDINWEIVFYICTNHLDDFRQFASIFSTKISE
ncbi:type VII toxin-antitoxin system HepT family RNase toxin [Nitrincola schmidtii]|uniref:type VII toxin-antitoxin system HepT family RNase toxin n=1 Tax=Nitrincola schmidtii TaxID=1730894 RepID=UPI00124BD466|nr:DUF86 domain-containing protein [Nitrincola schmidtii]